MDLLYRGRVLDSMTLMHAVLFTMAAAKGSQPGWVTCGVGAGMLCMHVFTLHKSHAGRHII